MTPREPAIILVPCADSGSIGCKIARRAAELVAAATGVAEVREVEECSRTGKSFVVAIDASSSCQASAALRDYCCRPGAVVSAAAVLARAGLVRPGVDLHGRSEELAQALAATMRDSLHTMIGEVEARQRYREEMAPIISRFYGIWEKLEATPPPNGAADPAETQKLELLGRRARNLFVKFDEIIPPAEWAEPHDLFQDALLCLAYATEGWVSGEEGRWEQNLEKARAQIAPLLKRLGG
jgi:hypothetical protein